MNITDISTEVLAGGQSQQIVLSTTSAPTTAVPALNPGESSKTVTFVVDAACFVRRGTNPTALSNGTDQYLIANKLYRCQMQAGEKLAFVMATGTGNAYVTFGA